MSEDNKKKKGGTFSHMTVCIKCECLEYLPHGVFKKKCLSCNHEESDHIPLREYEKRREEKERKAKENSAS